MLMLYVCKDGYLLQCMVLKKKSLNCVRSVITTARVSPQTTSSPVHLFLYLYIYIHPVAGSFNSAKRTRHGRSSKSCPVPLLEQLRPSLFSCSGSLLVVQVSVRVMPTTSATVAHDLPCPGSRRVAYMPYSVFKKLGIPGPSPRAFFGNASEIGGDVSAVCIFIKFM